MMRGRSTAPGSRRGAQRTVVAWVVFSTIVVVWLAAVGVALPRTSNPLDPGDVLWASSFLVLAALGRFVVSRRPGDVFGRLLLAGPLALGVGVLGGDYAGRTQEGAGWPGGAWFALTGRVAFALGAGAIALALYRFPDGRPVSRTWRGAEFVTLVGTAAAAVGALTVPVVADEPGVLVNPLVGGRLAATSAWLDRASVLLLVGGIASLVSIVARYRRGGPEVRAQLRWVLYPVAVAFVMASFFALAELLTGWEPTEATGIATTIVLTLGVPLGIIAAITRARLYDIDRIISRTATYAIVTTVLVGVYGALTVVPAALLGLESDLLVAAATLAAAAAFVPVRRQVQAVVDRRFNRSRYDAQRVVERFGSRLRRDVDLDSLTDALRGVVATTVQPAHVSLWLPRERGQ